MQDRYFFYLQCFGRESGHHFALIRIDKAGTENKLLRFAIFIYRNIGCRSAGCDQRNFIGCQNRFFGSYTSAGSRSDYRDDFIFRDYFCRCITGFGWFRLIIRHYHANRFTVDTAGLICFFYRQFKPRQHGFTIVRHITGLFHIYSDNNFLSALFRFLFSAAATGNQTGD